MGASIFIAITGNGLARAKRNAAGEWSVERLLSGRDVRCLAADPLDPELVYAGVQGGGLLRSTDGGRSWGTIALSGRTVKSIAASRTEPGTVYAGLKPPGILVSRDRGSNWTELDSFRRIPSRRFWRSPAEMPLTAYVQGIALSPADPDILVAGIEFGALVRSADGGRTWTDHRKGALRDCHSVTFHATDGRWVYEGGGGVALGRGERGGGAAISHDAGETWRQPKEGLDRNYGWAVAADPARPEVWYLSVSTGPGSAHGDGDAQAVIFRSMDGGPWQRLSGGLPEPMNYMAYALLTDPDAPGHLYAGFSNGEVWHSAAHGDSWERLPFNLGGIHRTMIMI
jgi:photosystem II stability/assembly factor-like uncharacterized protein